MECTIIWLENASSLQTIMVTIESKKRKNILKVLYDDEDELDIYLEEPPIKME